MGDFDFKAELRKFLGLDEAGRRGPRRGPSAALMDYAKLVPWPDPRPEPLDLEPFRSAALQEQYVDVVFKLPTRADADCAHDALIEAHEALHLFYHEAAKKGRDGRMRPSRPACRPNASSFFAPDLDARCGDAPSELAEAWQPCRDPRAEAMDEFEAADRSFDAGEWSSQGRDSGAPLCPTAGPGCRAMTPKEREAALDARVDDVLAKMWGRR